MRAMTQAEETATITEVSQDFDTNMATECNLLFAAEVSDGAFGEFCEEL